MQAKNVKAFKNFCPWHKYALDNALGILKLNIPQSMTACSIALNSLHGLCLIIHASILNQVARFMQA